MNLPHAVHRGRSSGWSRPALVPALVLLSLALATPAAAQFGPAGGDISEDARLSAYPTIDGIREARRAGHPPARILAWIREHDALFPLDLDEAMQLYAEGLEIEILAEMARMPVPEVRGILTTFERVYVARPEAREGLSKRHLYKMIEYGAPESEILAAIAERGSRAELSLKEAVDLLESGASPRLVVAIGRGVVPPEAARGSEPVPLLDDILAEAEEGDEEAEAVSLDEIFEEEGVAEEPGGEPRLVVLSDPPGARVMLAPANIRPTDLLTMPENEGRTPLDIEVAPGSWYVLVEKSIDSFDASIIPAMRTVHDGEGDTRTLVHNGTLYYDVKSCCRPKGLTGSVEITRIAADQPGVILGDEFDGLPPYLWDGNRYLILDVAKGQIERVIKVYEIRRAAGEEKILMATFIPSSADPLSHPASLDAVTTRARSFWVVPGLEELEGLGRLIGLPAAEVPRFHQRLLTTGKALWKQEDSEGARMLSLGLTSTGGLRLDRIELTRTDIFGQLATAGLTGPAMAEPPPRAEKEPGPMPPFTRVRRPETELPSVEIHNGRRAAAMVRLDDGTLFYIGPQETLTSRVSPGGYAVDVRFDGGEKDYLHGRVRFSYRSLYRLILD